MKRHKEDSSKVIFLDIDGVLNSDNFFTSKYHDRLMLSKGEHGVMHDPRACALLGKIKKATNCKIVMSSSWRNFYNKIARKMPHLQCGIWIAENRQTFEKLLY